MYLTYMEREITIQFGIIKAGLHFDLLFQSEQLEDEGVNSTCILNIQYA
jgi:hypothetical protein